MHDSLGQPSRKYQRIEHRVASFEKLRHCRCIDEWEKAPAPGGVTFIYRGILRVDVGLGVAYRLRYPKGTQASGRMSVCGHGLLPLEEGPPTAAEPVQVVVPRGKHSARPVPLHLRVLIIWTTTLSLLGRVEIGG